MYESLHNHTILSDGELSHSQLLKEAVNANFKRIFFTDHDSLPTTTYIGKLKRLNSKVLWDIGVELTSKPPKESDVNGSIHILGFFIDLENPTLLQHIKDVAESRNKRVEFIVKYLARLGFEITIQDCRRVAGKDKFIGTPHIVTALMNNPRNHTTIREIAERMRKKSETNQEVNKDYKVMMSENIDRWPYTLFMKSDSFLPMPTYSDSNQLKDLDGTVKIIREAGGIAILAHWFAYKDIISKKLLEELLSSKRLDGVETDTLGYGVRSDNEREDDARFLISLSEKYNCISSNGADAHKKGDLLRWVKLQPKAVRRSIGQTERIISTINSGL